MKREHLHHLRSRILESMAYISAYAPDFPEEDGMTLSKVRDRLVTDLGAYKLTLKTDDQKKWHQLAETEIHAAFDAYASGQRNGSSEMGRAQEHFRKSFKPKKIRPDFICGADGEVYKT
jgi:hypothetical protein